MGMPPCAKCDSWPSIGTPMLCKECAQDPKKLIEEARRIDAIHSAQDMPWVHTVASVNQSRWRTEKENIILRTALQDIVRMKPHDKFEMAAKEIAETALKLSVEKK